MIKLKSKSNLLHAVFFAALSISGTLIPTQSVHATDLVFQLNANCNYQSGFATRSVGRAFRIPSGSHQMFRGDTVRAVGSRRLEGDFYVYRRTGFLHCEVTTSGSFAGDQNTYTVRCDADSCFLEGGDVRHWRI